MSVKKGSEIALKIGKEIERVRLLHSMRDIIDLSSIYELLGNTVVVPEEKWNETEAELEFVTILNKENMRIINEGTVEIEALKEKWQRIKVLIEKFPNCLDCSEGSEVGCDNVFSKRCLRNIWFEELRKENEG